MKTKLRLGVMAASLLAFQLQAGITLELGKENPIFEPGFEFMSRGIEFTNMGSISGSTRAALALGNDGKLYGTTISGGNGYGTCYRSTVDGGYTNLFSFTGNLSDGAYPFSGLYGDGANFYGCANTGGTNNDGIIFKITTNGSWTKIFNLKKTTTGGSPIGGPLLVNDVLYGITENGGTDSHGMVYAISTGGTLLGATSLNTTSGYSCQMRPTQGTNGYAYACVTLGGQYGYGSIIRFSTNPASLGLTRIVSFTNSVDGGYPNSTLTLVPWDNRLYGTTHGSNVTIFRLEENNTITTIATFPENGSPQQVTIGPKGARTLLSVLNYSDESGIFQWTPGGSLVEVAEVAADSPYDISIPSFILHPTDNRYYSAKTYNNQKLVRLSIPVVPQITKVKNVNCGTNEVTLSTIAGQDYTVKGTCDLAAGFTNTITFTATGSQTVITDPITAKGEAFYYAYVDAEGVPSDFYSNMKLAVEKLPTAYETIPCENPFAPIPGGGTNLPNVPRASSMRIKIN